MKRPAQMPQPGSNQALIRISYICPGKAYVVGIAPRANVTDVSVWKAFLQEHRFKETSFAVNSL